MCPLGHVDQSQIILTNGCFDELLINLKLESTPLYYDDRGGLKSALFVWGHLLGRKNLCLTPPFWVLLIRNCYSIIDAS